MLKKLTSTNLIVIYFRSLKWKENEKYFYWQKVNTGGTSRLLFMYLLTNHLTG